jgi:hypothetical protein
MALRAGAAEERIDLFSDASALTQYVEDTNVKQGTVGSTTRVDPNLSGDIGRSRKLIVTMTAAMVPGLDAVVAGVQFPLLQLFRYSSSAGADGGYAAVRSQRQRPGRDARLRHGAQVTIAADLTCVTPGLGVTIRFTDSFLTTVSSTQQYCAGLASHRSPSTNIQFALAGI